MTPSSDARIVRNAEVLGGKPRFAGTRLSIEFVQELLASGGTPESIASAYPALTPDDVRAAIAFVSGEAAAARFIVRPARKTDAPALASLATATFRETFADSNTPEDMAAYLEANFSEPIQSAEITNPANACFVAASGESLIGYCLLREIEPEACVADREAIELQRLYILRAWHGKGVARALLENAFTEARRRGARTLWLGVWEHNHRALAFYAKHGFTRVGEHDFVLGSDVQTDLILTRSL